MRLRPRHVRTRLTLLFVSLFAALLVIYIACASMLQFWQLTSQLYHGAIQDVETAEGLLYFTADGRVAMHEDYHNRPESLLLIDRMMEVYGADGTVLYRNARLENRDFGGKLFPGEGETSYNDRTDRLSDGTGVLLISHAHSIDGRPLLIRLGYSLTPLEYRMAEQTSLLLLAVPLVLAFAGYVGFRMTGQALHPLEKIALQAEQITASRLHDRVPIDNPNDELGHIARVLNGLLTRLEASFEQLRRFTSDVSHELRTPLASLRGVGEMGLEGEYTAKEYRDIIGSMLEEVTRLTHMVESLLTISRADSGELTLKMSEFKLLDLVNESVGLVDVIAEEKEQALKISGEPELTVRGDRLFLRHAIINVLHNAVKYSPAGSEIDVSIYSEVEAASRTVWANLEIIDRGPGIPEEHSSKVFDRFYRVDEGRSRDSGGAGLGLAIAKWAVEIHGGRIGVRSSQMVGSCFFIKIPNRNGQHG